MLSKTSFFNKTLWYKDITRYFPVWVVYLAFGLLVTKTFFIGNRGDYFIGQSLAANASVMGLVNLVYAGVIALVLFGDLFHSRMCNALHALPVRRESWFLTHTAAGLTMSLVPNLVMTAMMLLPLGQFWYTGLWWLAMMQLQFLFFFGLAVFSVYCVGNRLAASLVYLLLNFGAMLVLWVVAMLIMPHLYGVELRPQQLTPFSPAVGMFSLDPLWELEHSVTCGCRQNFFYDGYHNAHEATLVGMGDDWWYLILLAAVGVGFLVAALALYRVRKLESAGDFAAVRSLKTIVSMVGSVLMGMTFALFGGYTLLLIGLVLGFFLSRMLLERKVNVFGGRNWLRLTALVTVFALVVVLGAVDVLGITRRVPRVDRVKSVTIAESYLSWQKLDQIQPPEPETNTGLSGGNGDLVLCGVDPNYLSGREGMLTICDRELIREVMEIHRLLIREGNPRSSGHFENVTIHYILDDGSTLTRHYSTREDGEALRRLRMLTNTPEYILGVTTAEELLADLQAIYLEGDKIVYRSWLKWLTEALFEDAREGRLQQDEYGEWLELHYEDAQGKYRVLSLRVPKGATRTQDVIQRWRETMKEQGRL